jgi:hypothetical protein
MSTARHIFAVGLATALAVGTGAAVRAQGRDYPPQGPNRLSGTFELDRTRSDDPERIADQATRSLPPDQRDRVHQNLLNRLNAPQSLAIDLRGRSVTIASSTGPRATFDADGRNRTEAGPNGRPLTTRADMRGDGVMVTTTGNRGSDFTVQFDPVPGGLQVTRELDSEVIQGSVTARSFYRRVADEPRWSVYEAGPPMPPPPPPGMVLVPDGTQLIGRLDRPLSTRTTREGERFSMVVDNGPFRGAAIDGIVSHITSGNGRANMVFDFRNIRLADGRNGPLDAAIESVRTPDGQVIRINRSGESIRNDQATGASGQDTAVGAAVGALIGAIAGGGKGAAVGALVGGAGTVAVEGRDQLDLPAGSEVTLSVIGPRRVPAPVTR